MPRTCSILLLFLPVFCFAQLTPGVRNAHSMIYHEGEGVVYLFGGATDSEVKGDLWTWKKDEWTEVPAIGPSPRTFASMVYDAVEERIVLFGGSKVLFGNGPNPGNLLNDTWIFQDGNWLEVLTEDAPPQRAESAMAYDPTRNLIVLFGGYEIQGKSYVPVGDTWEFDGNSWTLFGQKGPSKRNNASMVYDNERNLTILFGGSAGRNGYGEGKGETWTWNGDLWSKLEIIQPANVFNAAMATTKDGVMRFGGWNGKERLYETWILTAEKWKRLSPRRSPGARNHSAMVYDSSNDQILIYGGHDGHYIFGDLWRYRSNNWEKLSETPLKARIANGH